MFCEQIPSYFNRKGFVIQQVEFGVFRLAPGQRNAAIVNAGQLCYAKKEVRIWMESEIRSRLT